MPSPADQPPAVRRPAPQRGGARAGAVALGRAATRGIGLATWAYRPLPDFLIIGAKRGGTTSLHSALAEHPQVLPLFPSGRTPLKRTDTKGLHYFAPGPMRPAAWYRSHFPTTAARRWAGRTGRPVAAGEASPYYLYHPWAAARAAGLVPQTRVIAVLRDPVERTFSHYREQRRNGIETLTFREALAVEDERLAGEQARLLADPDYVSFAHEHQSYRAQSAYADGLRRWLDHYPRGQVLVLASEDFYARPQQAYDEVVRFLGLAPHRLQQLSVLNAAPPADLPPDLREQLRQHFAADVAAVEELAGRPMGWPAVSG